LQEKIRFWLCPPDPWTNYNTARKAHQPGTATWFTQGNTFANWKSTGSLLWVNGLRAHFSLPSFHLADSFRSIAGSGKTIISYVTKPFLIQCTYVTNSSSIIKDIQDMCPTGLAILAIFYFHFGETAKQDARNLISSVLIRLCSQSDKFSQVLLSIYSSHGNGSREPSLDTLLECLKKMLALQGQGPLYIVVDALDECPNSSGLLTQRQEVLEIVKELIDLELPHLHFCVTSRPEIDIRRTFDPLNPYQVALHNQDGQIKDLAIYVKSVVGSDAMMQNWPAKVKELVIDTLSEKGCGMYVVVVLTLSIPFSCDDFRFRWAYCQLETLRQCPLRYISSTLDELPETLDETYERILQGIPKKMQKDAYRIFQWLFVSPRPLRVEEVAEVFAINFDEEISGIPKFEPIWRDANAETAVLSACSTLITIVDGGDWWPRRKIVQFSHFSVKEYLTSDRTENVGHASRFYIHPKPAHTLLAKTCISILFQLDHSTDEAKIKDFPLAEYAAENWVEHAWFEDVSSYIQDGMCLLFEKDKPYFAAWVSVYNKVKHRTYPVPNTRLEQLDPVPLYYAALCGLPDLVERLLTTHPQDLNAEGGNWGSPLNAALAKGNLDIALFLLDRGADWENRGEEDQTGLYIASSRGYSDVVRSLIDRGADLNAICKDRDENEHEVKWTPLHAAIHKKRRDVAIQLLERGADAEIMTSLDQTVVYVASIHGCADVVRSLINRGADLNLKCQDWVIDRMHVKWTPLHAAVLNKHRDVVLLLLEGGADTEIPSSWGETALLTAPSYGCADILLQLISHGADVNAECKCGGSDRYYRPEKWTPLHAAVDRRKYPVAKVLLEHGANPDAPGNLGETALHLESSQRGITNVELLLEYGANVDVQDKEGWTPLHKAAYHLHPQTVAVLLGRGADPHARTNKGETPIQLANAPYIMWEEQARVIRLLSEQTGERM